MPGLVLFTRRWSFGSDDLFLPSVYLLIGHLLWIGISMVIVFAINKGTTNSDWLFFTVDEYIAGLAILWAGCAVVEAAVAWVSVQGTILDARPRSIMGSLIYVRLGILVVECGWHITGILWLILSLSTDTLPIAASILGLMLTDWIILLLVCCGPTSANCIRMRTLPDLSSSEPRSHQPCHNISTDQLDIDDPKKQLCTTKPVNVCKVRHSICCHNEHNKVNTYSDIASLLFGTVSDVDLVPSDVIAGLVLLRRYQKLHQRRLVAESCHEVYQYLSGAPVTPSTRFLSLKNSDTLHDYKRLVCFATYTVKVDECRRQIGVLPQYSARQRQRRRGDSRCCPCSVETDRQSVSASCGCPCSLASLGRKTSTAQTCLNVVYASCHLLSGENFDDKFNFFIDVNHAAQSVVICISGLSCLQGVVSNAVVNDAEIIPNELDVEHDNWLAHRGLLHAALHITSTIRNDSLISLAYNHSPEQGTSNYSLVVVGHSLAAGVASLVTILMRRDYPSIHCYAYCPPGGVLSASCVEETRHVITSVVVGKDCIPRLAVHQMLLLRHQVMTLLQMCTCPKWRITSHLAVCSRRTVESCLLEALASGLPDQSPVAQPTCNNECPKLYAPGCIVHIVRSRPKKQAKLCNTEGAVYQAIWAHNTDFEEVLISPSMIRDHSPHTVLDALKKLSTRVCPAKPSRKPPRSSRGSHVPATTPTNASSEFDSGCHVVTASSAPSSYGVAKAVTPCSGTAAAAPGLQCRDRPHDPTILALKRNMQLDVPQINGRSDGDFQRAPLASPEALSETSSLASYGSGSFHRQTSVGTRRMVTSQAMRMDTIRQSPLCRSSPPPTARLLTTRSSPGYCLLVSDSTLKDSGCVVLSPDESNVQRDEDAFDVDAEVGSALLLPEGHPSLCQTVAEVHHNVDSPTLVPSTGICQSCVGNVEPQKTVVDDDSVAKDVELVASDEKTVAADSSLVANDDNKLVANNCRMVSSDNSSVANDNSALAPVSIEVFPDTQSVTGSCEGCSQIIYDSYAGHYSPAGRGYPHGFSPSLECLHSPSCTVAVDNNDFITSSATGNESQDFESVDIESKCRPASLVCNLSQDGIDINTSNVSNYVDNLSLQAPAE